MKKYLGIALLSTMLILGQSFTALASSISPKLVNFEDIEGIIINQNIEVEMNKNNNLKGKVDLSDIKKTIRDLEGDLDYINNLRDNADPITSITLGTTKRQLLNALKDAERGLVDKPTLEATLDLSNTMKDESIIRDAQGLFIQYHQLETGISSLKLNIETLQKKLLAMEIQESLGMVSRYNLNDLRTTITSLQTQLEGIQFTSRKMI